MREVVYVSKGAGPKVDVRRKGRVVHFSGTMASVTRLLAQLGYVVRLDR